MTPRGRAWVFGDDISGDDGIIEFAIVRDSFGKEFDEDALRAMCFRRLRPEFPAQVKPGDIVVGGRNFAHHNHVEVSVAIRASGIAVVVVESCDAGFLRRALNNGLPVMIKKQGFGFDIDSLDDYYEDCVIGGAGAGLATAHFASAQQTSIPAAVAAVPAGVPTTGQARGKTYGQS